MLTSTLRFKPLSFRNKMSTALFIIIFIQKLKIEVFIILN